MKHTKSIYLSVLAACVACDHATQIHPAPPAATRPAEAERRLSFPSSPALQRLANAGAWINPDAPSKWDGVGTYIDFRKQEVNSEQMSDVRHVQGKVFLGFSACNFTDGSLRPLNQMPNLNSFHLEGSAADREMRSGINELPGLQRFIADSRSVTAKGLSFLALAPQLGQLSLNGARFGDDVLKLIRENDSLARLDLDSTSVTDGGLRHLVGLSKLSHLSLNNCQITDAGVQHLLSMKELRELVLAHTKLSDAGLGTLRRLPCLEMLDVSGTNISDASLAQVAAIGRLRFLFIRDTPITDRGLAEFQACRTLEEIYAEGTAATTGAQKLLPNTRIICSDKNK